MKALFILLAVMLFGPGCSKNSGEKDSVPPVIIITDPVNGQVYTTGQNIPISGTITDDQFIAEVHIHVSNTNTGALLMDVHIYPTASTASFDQSIAAVAGVSYKIQVIAKDRAVNETNASVNVSCN